MHKLKTWVAAARLRTLPLSLSGIIVGTALAQFYGFFNSTIFILALLTTVAFQIISNLANDYGDGIKGTDDDQRVGPSRALQSGALTAKELKRGIFLISFVALALSIALIYNAFSFDMLPYFLIFLVLGCFSIWAAIRYTVGKSAYGYRGLGDFFVFVFFGLVSVLGSLFLYTKFISFAAVFPAIAVGLLSVGVLNLNNLRDVHTDSIHNKNTLIVKIGFENGKWYHYALMLFSFVGMLVFGFVEGVDYKGFAYMLAFIPTVFHVSRIYRSNTVQTIDPELKKLALNTFLLAVSFYISINYFF